MGNGQQRYSTRRPRLVFPRCESQRILQATRNLVVVPPVHQDLRKFLGRAVRFYDSQLDEVEKCHRFHTSMERPLTGSLMISPESGSTDPSCFPRRLYFSQSPCCV